MTAVYVAFVMTQYLAFKTCATSYIRQCQSHGASLFLSFFGSVGITDLAFTAFHHFTYIQSLASQSNIFPDLVFATRGIPRVQFANKEDGLVSRLPSLLTPMR